MSVMHRCQALPAVVWAVLSILLGEAGAQARLPNLVFYISDDQSQRDASAYGATLVKTPTIDRLAKDGMVFDNAFIASPACAPSRSALLTGLMPARNGAEENHAQVQDSTRFLPRRLQAAGYRVAAFGKVAHQATKTGMGFNHVQGMPKRGNLSGAVAGWYDGLADKSKPMCVMVGDDRPHVSWIDSARYRPADVTLPPTFIDTKETREHWTRYLTDIHGMDAEMGKVYDWARATFGNDFIFLYSSDHGGQWPFGKWNLYDAGIKVPLVVVAPGRVAAARRTGAMVSWVDILPTLFDFAGVTVPAGLDGRSFRAVLEGGASAHRSHVFTTHSGDLIKNVFPIRSVRTPTHKYILNPYPQYYHSNHSDMDRLDGAGAYWHSWDRMAKTDSTAANIRYRYYVRPKEEFYDLAADPWEQTNLIGEAAHQEEIRRLRGLLSDWMSAQGDTVTLFRPPYPITGPRPANTDTIRPWQGPVALAPRAAARFSPRGGDRAWPLFRGGEMDGEEAGLGPRYRPDGRTVPAWIPPWKGSNGELH